MSGQENQALVLPRRNGEPAGLLGRIPAARWLRCTCASAVGSQLCPEWGCAVSPSLPSLRNGRRASSAAFLVWVSWSIRWHRARGALQRGPGVQPAAQCNVHSSLCMLASPADQLRVVGASTRCKTWGGGGPRDGQCPRKHLPKIVYCARCHLTVYRSNTPDAFTVKSGCAVGFRFTERLVSVCCGFRASEPPVFF